MHIIGKKGYYKIQNPSRDVSEEVLNTYPELYGHKAKDTLVLCSLRGRAGTLHAEFSGNKKLKLIFYQCDGGSVTKLNSVKVEDVRKSLAKKTILTNIGEIKISDPAPLENLINAIK